MKKLFLIALFIHCGSEPFPAQIPMHCITPYGELNTTVFVDDETTISYSINAEQTFILTREAKYCDGVLTDGTTTLKETENGYLLTSTGVHCE